MDRARPSVSPPDLKSPVSLSCRSDPLSDRVDSSPDGSDALVQANRQVDRPSVEKIVIDEAVKLGAGSFGTVYAARDQTGRSLAVKCCRMTDRGIPNILETSIMATFRHPYINTAEQIFCSEETLFIVQERAQSDLGKHLRTYQRESDGRITNPNQITFKDRRTWCHQLALAVGCLHQNRIIHADIKSGNVLYYPDKTVKLTDFTLSVKKWKSSDTFTSNACTNTHRPIECFLPEEEWDEAVDIWSLGCTFYEIMFNEPLFPYQGPKEKLEKITKKMEPDRVERIRAAKKRIQQRFINALIEWGDLTCQAEYFPTDPNVRFLHVKLHDDFYKNGAFADLILKMLKLEATDRISIRDVLAHPFFSALPATMYNKFDPILRPIDRAENARAIQSIRSYLKLRSTKTEATDNAVASLALSLYNRSQGLTDWSENMRIQGVLLLAEKIVRRTYPFYLEKGKDPVELEKKRADLCRLERDLCHRLGFIIHEF